MSEHLSGANEAGQAVDRRDVLKFMGYAGVAALGARVGLDAIGFVTPIDERNIRGQHVADVYADQISKLSDFVNWTAMVSERRPDGSYGVSIADDITDVRHSASLGKLGMALGVFHSVDENLISLQQPVHVAEDMADPGAATGLHEVESVGSLLGHMISRSSNAAFRALETVLPGQEVNDVLQQKGLDHTVLMPSTTHEGRYDTGLTTAQDMHNLLFGLATDQLLTQRSTDHFLGLMRNSTFNFGIRRDLTSSERRLTPTKYGQLQVDMGTSPGMGQVTAINEAGIHFADDARRPTPQAVFAFLAHSSGTAPNVPGLDWAANNAMKITANAAHAQFGLALAGR